MSRGFKKAVYGIFYLCIFGIIAFSVYSSLEPEVLPTCSDGIINQGEEAVDCGGPCIPCEVKNLRQIRMDDPVQPFFLSDGRVVLLGSIVNPNEGYIAENVEFEFIIKDKTGYPVERIYGSDLVYPLEKRYVFTANVETKSGNFGEASVEIASSTVVWEKYYETLKPVVQLVSPPVIMEEETIIRAKGTIRNQSSFTAKGVTVIGIVRDSYNHPIFAAQWVSDDLEGFETRDFSIIIPKENEIIERFDRERMSFIIQIQ